MNATTHENIGGLLLLYQLIHKDLIANLIAFKDANKSFGMAGT